MNIKNDDCLSVYYAIVSYSHADLNDIEADFKAFDDNGVCYWFDEEMEYGKSYRQQFFDTLDNQNCRGIVFFVTASFLLSENCAAEAEYFLNEYKRKGKNEKFCYLVLSEDLLPCIDTRNSEKVKSLREKMEEYKKRDLDSKSQEYFDKMSEETLNKHIKLFLELVEDGKLLCGTIGKEEYVKKCCEKGQTFAKAGILLGQKEITTKQFGYFPQKENRSEYTVDIGTRAVSRRFDQKPAYYAPVDWFVIKTKGNTEILLSEKLLFTIDYLGLKYPLKPNEEVNISEYITKMFGVGNNFQMLKEEEEKYKIKKVRFLKEEELKALLLHCHSKAKNNSEMIRKILLPEPTYFAQITNRKDTYAFWLAGDTEDARRVDTGIEGLSPEKPGVELYYVRIVIEVEKLDTKNSEVEK